jgi:DNA-binding response OmpR family regulator
MHGKRVLVVDDEPLIREMLRECLGAEGWEIACAADGTEALRIGSDADVALVDAVLPGSMTGLDLAARLEACGVPVLMMSGQPEALDAMSASDRRAVLAKPFRIAAVVEALRTLCRAGAAGELQPPAGG